MDDFDARFEKEIEAQREAAKMEVAHFLGSYYTPEEIGYTDNLIPSPEEGSKFWPNYKRQLDKNPDYRNWYLIKARHLLTPLAALVPDYKEFIMDLLEENEALISSFVRSEIIKQIDNLLNQ